MDNISELREKFNKSILKIDEVILGKKNEVELMFVALLAKGHVLLDDTPGMGKTTLARSISSVLGLDLRRIQFTSDLMPSDIVGVSVINSSSTNIQSMKFQPGPVFTHLLLADEINRASPRTQSALLEAMAEKQVTVDGITHQLPNPFWVIATQNPVDFSGTYPLPESQMDRFLFRMNIGYPGKSNEIDLLLGKGGLDTEQKIQPILTISELVQAQKMVTQQKANNEMVSYLHKLIEATRNHPEIITGLSPRAGLSILQGAKALSWLMGRSYVLPDDVKKIFVLASAHRLIMHHSDYKERQKISNEILLDTSCP